MTTTPVQALCYLDRPEGRVGYEVSGDGPLVVLVPGMGDLRSAYRFLAPALRDGGYRVACTDLRGHGDSDASFASYGDIETAGDIVALIEKLGGPAVVVGDSMGAGAAVYAAAGRPETIRGAWLSGADREARRPCRGGGELDGGWRGRLCRSGAPRTDRWARARWALRPQWEDRRDPKSPPSGRHGATDRTRTRLHSS